MTALPMDYPPFPSPFMRMLCVDCDTAKDYTRLYVTVLNDKIHGERFYEQHPFGLCARCRSDRQNRKSLLRWIFKQQKHYGRCYLPVWQRCVHCENYWCMIHVKHAHECSCPPVEEWKTSPYL